MNNLQTQTAILAGKSASMLSRFLRIGGGTTLPGTLAQFIAPNILHHLTSLLPNGVTLVAGTNGKTTTARMLATIFQANGNKVLHNRAGANLISGLTATTIAHSSIAGHPHADIGLFETDEAALPEAIEKTRPRYVLLHNLFRDQLDRYGEVDTIAKTWKESLATLPATSTILLNADDPAIAHLGEGLNATICYYGLEDARHATGSAIHTADSHFCRQCGARYHYSLAFYGHIGHYHCPNCGHHRPDPHIRLERLNLNGTQGSHLFITHPSGALDIQLPLPGLYNALNALAATAAAMQYSSLPHNIIRNELERFSAAFGRIERVQAGAGGPNILIALIKNPVGASETVRMLTETAATNQQALSTFIIINDLHADGTDVSWLWDADFEPLQQHIAHATVSGIRAYDMAIRLKYAQIPEESLYVEPDIALALDAALAKLPDGETLFVLPTYTAMLHLREHLVQRGWVRPFWQE